MITLGSSKELAEKLEEPSTQPSTSTFDSLQHDLQPSELHVFEIEERDYVRKLWQDIKESDNGAVGRDPASATEWSAEKKNRLALLYKKRTAEIWRPIAEELNVTWESVNEMHWAMGKDEMARRASEHQKTSEENAERKPDSAYTTSDTRRFEDFRVHHFNATQPPQVQLQLPVSYQPVKITAGQASIPSVSALNLNRSASSVTGNNGEANLVHEKKRQAQAAGGKVQSRMTAVDSHQKRWANYKSSTSAFLPKASTSVSLTFDGPGLTSEGKRQAQVAGDRLLRCRTTPIRHSRPEHGITKNRWSSYSGTRPTRFDERKGAQDEVKDTSNNADTEEASKSSQPSLLEVFEAELAKKSSTVDSEGAPLLASPVVQSPMSESSSQVESSRDSQGQPWPQGSQALLGHIDKQLHEMSARNAALSQEFLTAIDRGVRGLGTCIQNIVRGLQEVSSVSRQAADRAQKVDLQLIDDAAIGFRNLAGGFAAALGREVAANWPGTTSAPRSQPGETEIGAETCTISILPGNDPEEDEVTAHKSNQCPLNGGDDQSQLVFDPESNHATVPRYLSPEPAILQPEVQSKTGSEPAMSKEPRLHSPGPSHLPHRPGYVDRLRQSQSTDVLEEQCDIQSANSPRFETHFPTLAQFEGENFGVGQAFPALPGMEPLIPQRVSHQHTYSRRAGECEPANESLSTESRLGGAAASRGYHNPVTAAPWNGHETISLSRLSSAARLAGPFDPLEAQSSAQPHLTEGLRRNATVASTNIRHTARRRRPYSEVFDGVGRVPWDSFLQDHRPERRSLHRASDHKRRPLGANQEHSRRAARPNTESRRSPPVAAKTDDHHHDDSTVGRINDCVELLRDLGFGGKDNHSDSRLLVYAQATDGVLADAIDLIDEEQRAWQRL